MAPKELIALVTITQTAKNIKETNKERIEKESTLSRFYTLKLYLVRKYIPGKDHGHRELTEKEHQLQLLQDPCCKQTKK